jgi:hypothetical protein
LSKAVLFFAALSAAAQTVIEPRVVSETLPSGGLMQIKLDFTSPHPITTTSSDFSFDSAFESVEGVSILSPSGDAYGVGYARNARFHANIVSPLASLGTQLDYPFLMVAAKIRSGIPAGTVIPISFGTATFFNGPGGGTVLPACAQEWRSDDRRQRLHYKYRPWGRRSARGDHGSHPGNRVQFDHSN